MISLDKKILDLNSPVAKRMKNYGQEDELFVLVPVAQKKQLSLSANVQVFGTGGNKIGQFFGLIRQGKNIIKQNFIGFITVQDPFFTGLAGWILKKTVKARLEVQLHGDFYSSDYYKTSGWKNYFQYYLGKFIIRRADSLRVVGLRIKDSLLKMGVLDQKIFIQPIKIDARNLSSQPIKINLKEKYIGYDKIFLCLGRLESVKNLNWLIDVFAQALKSRPNYLLLIVGQGSERAKLARQIEDFGLEKNIKMEDWTNDPISYLKTVDCLLFSSLSEGYGLSVMEAVAVGCPVFMNDVGVGGYEVKAGEKVKIIPLVKEKWVEQIMSI